MQAVSGRTAVHFLHPPSAKLRVGACCMHAFMQAVSGHSPVPSRPLYIRVSISSDLVGKTNQTLLLVEDLYPVLLRTQNH
jgi:hypothetical protein